MYINAGAAVAAGGGERGAQPRGGGGSGGAKPVCPSQASLGHLNPTESAAATLARQAAPGGGCACAASTVSQTRHGSSQPCSRTMNSKTRHVSSESPCDARADAQHRSFDAEQTATVAATPLAPSTLYSCCLLIGLCVLLALTSFHLTLAPVSAGRVLCVL